MRPLCKCGKRPVAVNYRKGNKTFYRTKWDVCIRNKGKELGEPKWYQAGYRQKTHCEKCNFKATFREQMRVFHIDGDLNNNRPSNMKTICANCQIAMQREGSRWKQGDLEPDF